MTEKILVLQTADLPERAVSDLKQRFDVIRNPADANGRQALLAQYGSNVRAIAGTGKGRVDQSLLDQLPALEIISSYSAGLDAIDTEAAAARGIAIANTSHVLANDVADTALWLTMSVLRRFVEADRFTRSGAWLSEDYPLATSLDGAKVGILGLGSIGKALAKRLDCLGSEVGYNGRNKQNAVPYSYFPTLTAMAEWSDVLVICCPATSETIGIVDEAVLAALGPAGAVINIARGSIVDEPAMVRALTNGTLGGVGLDVFAHEPNIPEVVREHPRAVTTPHIGSATEATRQKMGQAMVAALVSHFGL